MTPEKPSDPPLKELQLSKGIATYTDQGEGPAIIAIHGLPGSVRDFRWLGAAISDNVRLIRVDLPGFGGTPKACEPGITIQKRGAFVAEFVQTLGIEQAIYMGHSMGGPVALEAAVQYPGRCIGLALIASVGITPHKELLRNRPNLVSKILRIPGMRTLMKSTIKKAYKKGGFPDSTPYSEMVRSIHIVGNISFARIREDHKQLTLPTFVSWAEDDRLIEIPVSEELADASPKGPRLKFPTGGHNIQKTQAVELGKALEDWCRELPFD